MNGGPQLVIEQLHALMVEEKIEDFNNLRIPFQFFSLCDKELGYLKTPDDKATLKAVSLFLEIHPTFNVNTECSPRMTVLFYFAQNDYVETAKFLFAKGLRWPLWSADQSFATHWDAALHCHDSAARACGLLSSTTILPMTNQAAAVVFSEKRMPPYIPTNEAALSSSSSVEAEPVVAETKEDNKISGKNKYIRSTRMPAGC